MSKDECLIICPQYSFLHSLFPWLNLFESWSVTLYLRVLKSSFFCHTSPPGWDFLTSGCLFLFPLSQLSHFHFLSRTLSFHLPSLRVSPGPSSHVLVVKSWRSSSENPKCLIEGSVSITFEMSLKLHLRDFESSSKDHCWTNTHTHTHTLQWTHECSIHYDLLRLSHNDESWFVDDRKLTSNYLDYLSFDVFCHTLHCIYFLFIVVLRYTHALLYFA